MVKDRCDKYKGKKTWDLEKDFVYKHCKKCPKNKTFKLMGLQRRRDVLEACQDTKLIENILKKEKDKKEKCVSFSKPWWYGWKGYPCKGTKDEKIYRKYLNDEIARFKKNDMNHKNPESIIKSYKKQIEALNEFYKTNKSKSNSNKSKKTKSKSKKSKYKKSKGGRRNYTKKKINNFK